MLSKIKIGKIGVVVFVLCSAVFFSGKAQAIEYGMLGGKPANPDSNIADSASWFIYKLAPGEKKQDALSVMNLYEKSLDVLVYAADGTKSSGGGFALEQYSESKDEVGSWVKFFPEDAPSFFRDFFKQKNEQIIDFCGLSKEDLQTEFKKIKISDEDFAAREKWCQGADEVSLTLSSKESKDIPFVFSVPDGSDVGEHTGGIIIQKVQPDDAGSSQEGSSVKLTTRVGVRIYETVPGQVIKKLAFSDFVLVKNYKEFNFMRWFDNDPKPEDFLVQGKIMNSGNVSVDFLNVINIKDDLFGKRTQEIADRNFQVLKNDTFISNYSWPSPRFGKFTFTMGLKYTNDKGEEQTTVSNPLTIWIFPWREVIVLALLALIFGGAYYFWKYHQKKKFGGVGWVEYVVKKNDTIANLADKFKVDWTVLTKTNKIKAPYLLAAGQVMLVPPTGKNPIKKEEKIKEERKEKTVEEEKTVKTVASKKNQKKVTLKEEEKKEKEPATVVVEKKRSIWKLLAVSILGAAVIAIIALAIWMLFAKYGNNWFSSSREVSITSIVDEKQGVVVDEKTEAPKQQDPAPAVEEKIDQAKLNVSVLNGGGVVGAAGKIKDFLVGKGYLATQAKNAESEDHTVTTIFYVDEKFKQEAEWIADILDAKKMEAVVAKASSDEEKSADIVVMIGK